jgi:hypothetical protein
MNAFWFHYNKPLSERRGHPTMTVHHKGACVFVRRIVCNVPTRSRERNSQPRMVIAGVGNVRISGDTAYITGDRA